MGSLKDQIFFSIFSIFSTFQTILSNFFLVITEFFFFEIFNFLDELGDSKTFLFFKVKSSFFWQFDYRKWEILVSPNSTRLVDIVGIFPDFLQNFRGGGGRGRGVQKSSFTELPSFINIYKFNIYLIHIQFIFFIYKNAYKVCSKDDLPPSSILPPNLW